MLVVVYRGCGFKNQQTGCTISAEQSHKSTRVLKFCYFSCFTNYCNASDRLIHNKSLLVFLVINVLLKFFDVFFYL